MNSEKLVIGNKYQIHGYKHNGHIHRAWDEAVLLEIHDEYLVFGNERTVMAVGARIKIVK